MFSLNVLFTIDCAFSSPVDRYSGCANAPEQDIFENYTGQSTANLVS